MYVTSRSYVVKIDMGLFIGTNVRVNHSHCIPYPNGFYINMLDMIKGTMFRYQKEYHDEWSEYTSYSNEQQWEHTAIYITVHLPQIYVQLKLAVVSPAGQMY